MIIKKTYIPGKPRNPKLVNSGGYRTTVQGSGGGTGGGGMTSSQLEILTNLADWWRLDEENDAIYSEKSVYSLKDVSAYGLGSDGSSGGGGSTVSWGTLTNGYRQLTVEGVTYALAQNTHKHLWADITDKPSTFAPSAHTHSAGDITSGTLSIARIPTGTTSSTVAIGNDSRITNGQTAYGWGNHASAGYALNSALSNYLPLTGGTLTGNLTLPNLTAESNVKTPKISIGNNWSIELVGTELQVKYNGALKQRFLADGSFVATGEVTAYK